MLKDMASQGQPPLTKKKITMLFVGTLRPPYYDKLIGNATKNFSDLVIFGEMIKAAKKVGKIIVGETSIAKKNGPPKKKEETSSTNYVSQPFC